MTRGVAAGGTFEAFALLDTLGLAWLGLAQPDESLARSLARWQKANGSDNFLLITTPRRRRRRRRHCWALGISLNTCFLHTLSPSSAPVSKANRFHFKHFRCFWKTSVILDCCTHSLLISSDGGSDLFHSPALRRCQWVNCVEVDEGRRRVIAS